MNKRSLALIDAYGEGCIGFILDEDCPFPYKSKLENEWMKGWMDTALLEINQGTIYIDIRFVAVFL